VRNKTMPEFKPLVFLILTITFHIVMFWTTVFGVYIVIVSILRSVLNVNLPTPFA
jgi:hypothetical protein